LRVKLENPPSSCRLRDEKSAARGNGANHET
jgi:hypothetical protein